MCCTIFIVGKPLDKRDQISNWDKRPLSDNQLIYAAFDAKVLIDLFDTLEDLAVNKKAEEVFHAVVAEQIRCVMLRIKYA